MRTFCFIYLLLLVSLRKEMITRFMDHKVSLVTLCRSVELMSVFVTGWTSAGCSWLQYVQDFDHDFNCLAKHQDIKTVKKQITKFKSKFCCSVFIFMLFSVILAIKHEAFWRYWNFFYELLQNLNNQSFCSTDC